MLTDDYQYSVVLVNVFRAPFFRLYKNWYGYQSTVKYWFTKIHFQLSTDTLYVVLWVFVPKDPCLVFILKIAR
jgi:hypothetical protein